MSRPIKATVFPSAIRKNLRLARHVAPNARQWGVIKANAYGHGIARVLDGFDEADGVALLDFAEAELVRSLGFSRPILLLEGFFGAEDILRIDALSLTTAVHAAAQLEMLAAARPARPINVYLKMNSGMNRLGFRPAEFGAAFERLRSLPAVGEITFMTHFSDADSPAGLAVPLANFERGCAGLSGQRSLCNSAAILNHSVAHADWIRPGILCYGSSPIAGRSAASIGLTPAMRLESEIIAIQDLVPGESIGYGARYRASAPMRIGVVACGYADGYPRVARDGTPVWVDGTMAPLVGQVSMDMITVDLSARPDVRLGAPVELWGTNVPVDDVAHGAGTVGYELLCALAARVPTTVGS